MVPEESEDDMPPLEESESEMPPLVVRAPSHFTLGIRSSAGTSKSRLIYCLQNTLTYVRLSVLLMLTRHLSRVGPTSTLPYSYLHVCFPQRQLEVGFALESLSIFVGTEDSL